MIRVEAQTGAEKWQSCQNGITARMNFEHSRQRPDDPDQRDNFLCAQPELYRDSSGPRLGFRSEEGQWINTRVLHSQGKISDRAVQQALDRNCANCPLYKLKIDQI